MKLNKPRKIDKKHPDVARNAMEDIKELTGRPHPIQNDVKYVGANRDRALGEADRTGRNYHEDVAAASDEESDASAEREAD